MLRPEDIYITLSHSLSTETHYMLYTTKDELVKWIIRTILFPRAGVYLQTIFRDFEKCRNCKNVIYIFGINLKNKSKWVQTSLSLVQ